MNRYRNVTVLALGVLLLSLMGCSNDSQEEDQGNDFVEASQGSDGSEEAEYISEYPEGWRPGSLVMTLSISQSGDSVDETSAQGGTKTSAKWDYSLVARQAFPVMIPPDFTRVLPDYTADAIDHIALEEELYIPLDNVAPVTEGQVSYSGRMEVRKPRANDITFLVEEVSAQAELNDLVVHFIQPSSVGEGFELDISFTYQMEGAVKTKAKHQSGSLQEYESECCERESQRQSFFPEPDMSVVQRISYPVEEGLPAEIAEMNQQMRMDRVALLQKISANLEPRAFLHTGLRWLSEPNQLTLKYHSESDNLLSHGGSLAMAAPASQRRYTLEIVLTAD